MLIEATVFTFTTDILLTCLTNYLYFCDAKFCFSVNDKCSLVWGFCTAKKKNTKVYMVKNTAIHLNLKQFRISVTHLQTKVNTVLHRK